MVPVNKQSHLRPLSTINQVKNIAKSPLGQNLALQTAMGSGGRGPEERSGKRTSAPVAQYSSTDLFDIVKGQLLDEGMFRTLRKGQYQSHALHIGSSYNL